MIHIADMNTKADGTLYTVGFSCSKSQNIQPTVDSSARASASS